MVAHGLRAAGVDHSQPLLAAVSGGPDSMALLEALCELRESLGLNVSAAHFNHRLRGDESDADAAFVREECRKRGVPCLVGGGDVAAYRASSRMSPEAAARKLRYEFRARAVGETGSQAVATAHTMNDQAETVLMHISRGAGIGGVAGMRPRFSRRELTVAGNPLIVVRPLLRVRRAETLAYCRARSIAPRRDPTNMDVARPRNRIRHRVVPQLEAVNPAAVEAIARLADVAAAHYEFAAREADRVMEAAASVLEHGRALKIEREPLAALPAFPRAFALRRAFERVAGSLDGLDHAHVEDMARLAAERTGAWLDLPQNVRFAVTRDCVILGRDSPLAWLQSRLPPAFPERPLPVPGRVSLGGGFAISAREVRRPSDLTAGAPCVAHLDRDALPGAITVRARRPGDRFQPLGMSQARKLKAVFADMRVPAAMRGRVPLVECARGIAWVAGYRPAEWAKVPRHGCETTLRLELVAPSRAPSPGGCWT